MTSVVETQVPSRVPALSPSPDGSPVANLRAEISDESGTLSAVLLDCLRALGVERAFGVSGGAIGTFCAALEASPIRFVHFRHESGAAFAAMESYFADDRPVIVFATSGPGLINALTGLSAARWEGAKIVVVSGITGAALAGRFACQETSSYTTPTDALFSPGPVFQYARALQSGAELPQVVRRISAGLQSAGGFIAHLGLPTPLQGESIPRAACARAASVRISPVAAPAETVSKVATLLLETPPLIWLGFGARHCAHEVARLVELTNATVVSSPRAKGTFSEFDPRALGVTGLAGYGPVEDQLRRTRPAHVLVLGTRLGEPTSFWQAHYVPTNAFIQVDADASSIGVAYPDVRTLGVHAEIGGFLRALNRELLQRTSSNSGRRPCFEHEIEPSPPDAPLHPRALMAAIQRNIIDATDAVVMTESGNAFAWGNQLLRFREPRRYRVSIGYGSMGHFSSGVVGAALARRGKAVVVTGDGSMLMNNEVSTAVQYNVPAVWIVLNDGAYGMVEQGMTAQGFTAPDLRVPLVDFQAWARSLGADGARVDSSADLDDALVAAMSAPGPFVVDVRVNPSEPGPWIKRIQSLILQGAVGGRQA